MDDSSSSRPVFYLSDRTGITARTLGHALLTQFQSIPFTTHTLPFINSPRRALRAVETINLAAAECGCKALVFSTLLDTEIKSIIADSNAIVFDYFSAFISPLEKELHADSSQITGLSHGIDDDEDYMQRMEALNFTLSNDDGANTHQYPAADIILVGASRSAKTPSCLYLALQFGLNAANYPLTGKDLTSDTLPAALKPHRKKLLGLTISPERLHRIRQKRRPDSDYASLRQCQKEIRAIEAIYHNEKVRYLDTSAMSVEEIATTIVQITNS
ncbi:MAG: kinase/pyrophosphorylase [Gammaproteobacteria bacterium]|nr:kinase/pyrophosphorylase [Gammaproteobacteria bacterium]